MRLVFWDGGSNDIVPNSSFAKSNSVILQTCRWFPSMPTEPDKASQWATPLT